MTSRISSRYQITIPPEVRATLKLSVDDPVEWRIHGNGASIVRLEKPLLKYKGAFKVGPGSIRRDIRNGRKARARRILRLQ